MPSGTWQLCFSFTVSNLIVSSFAGFSRTAWHNMDYLQWRHMNSGAYQTNSLHSCFPAQHQSPQGWESVQNSRRKCYSLQFSDCNSFKVGHISYTFLTSDTNLFSPFSHLLSEKNWDSIFKVVLCGSSACIKWHNCAQQLLLVFEGSGAMLIYICWNLIYHCISFGFYFRGLFLLLLDIINGVISSPYIVSFIITSRSAAQIRAGRLAPSDIYGGRSNAHQVNCPALGLGRATASYTSSPHAHHQFSLQPLL